jgi:hypothetical protein
MLHRTRTLLIAGLALGAMLITTGCPGMRGETETAVGQEPAQGANAEIEIRETPAGNRLVNLDVQWLPPPERIAPGANAYTVWIVPEVGAPVPAGRLEYDEGDRRGDLSITTPYERFTILITAEDAEVPPDQPSGVVVIEHEVMG